MKLNSRIQRYCVALASLLIGTFVCYRQPIVRTFFPPARLPKAAAIDLTLVGRFYDGDGMAVNRNLYLRNDGTYYCKWTGCLGDYGSSVGEWGRIGSTVYICTHESKGMFTHTPLSNLQILNDGARLFDYSGSCFKQRNLTATASETAIQNNR